VITEAGMKSYSTLPMALQLANLAVDGVPGMLALVGTWP
jgi:hypothetical protein